ncbi:MAG: histidine phosphatase family protein [Lachnospiraceae bacterium]|nr:histidine phosphatase family protein [Lachnospiraceae bacterium]
MTSIYFVRHAEPNYNNHNDLLRELTEKGLQDRKLVTAFLADKQIDKVLSSPYHRSVDTVKDFADRHGFEIEIVEDFRERKIDNCWIEDFEDFCRKQWADFDYKLTDGETLHEVQQRNIAALMEVVKQYPDKNLVVGSHGTALSTIINHFKPSFGYEDFQRIRGLMPWIVRFDFEGEACIAIEEFNVFELNL